MVNFYDYNPGRLSSFGRVVVSRIHRLDCRSGTGFADCGAQGSWQLVNNIPNAL